MPETPRNNINGGTALIAEVYTAYIASKTGRPKEEVRREVQQLLSEQLEAKEAAKPKVEPKPIDPNYLPTNADFGFPPTWKNFRTADFFAEKLDMTIEEVQRLYREEREKFYQLIDAQGLRVTVRAEDL